MAAKYVPAKAEGVLTRHTLLWLGLLFGIGLYFVDAVVDARVFDKGNFADQVLHPSSHDLWMRSAVFFLTVIVGMVADSRLRRERESTILAQTLDRRWQTLFDSAADSIFVIDAEGMILQANRYTYEHSGYGRDELLGRNIKDFFTEASQHTCDCNFPGLRERGYSRADVEFVSKDGSVLKMECSATGVPNESGEFASFLIIQRDITERAHAQAALLESERRFRAIFNSTFQFIGLLDPEGSLLEANQTALDFIGQTNADVVDKPFWETPWWTHSAEAQDSLREGIRQAAHGKLVRFETRHVSKEGIKAVIDFSLKPVVNEHGETVLIIPEGRDITERKQAEEAARQYQQESAHVMRLGTMGEMASGMAHELNQPLTALTSYCGTASKLASGISGPPQALLDVLARATEQAQRAGDIIRHLREFVSKGRNAREPVDIDGTIQGVTDFISWELRDNGISIQHQAGARGHMVLADRIQIEQVLVNLFRNSIEAIRGAHMSAGEVIIASRLLPDNSIEVTVSDNGPGIDQAISERLFAPYQTSKASGMGMGLSISRSIIEDHNGKLWVDTSHKGGALFGFTLSGTAS